jgi:hypothetical protein
VISVFLIDHVTPFCLRRCLGVSAGIADAAPRRTSHCTANTGRARDSLRSIMKSIVLQFPVFVLAGIGGFG